MVIFQNRVCMFGFLPLAILIFCGCSGTPVSKPILTSVADDRAVFSMKADSSFLIELGRGSGRHGLDTISIESTGSVLIRRRTRVELLESSFSITTAEIAAILDSTKLNGIMRLDREYHQKNVRDGTQWIFLAVQDDNVKSIYFNNYIPDQMTNFASDLDSILDIANRKLNWKPADIDDVTQRLWQSIRN
jgi:hypothetical protein